MADISTLTAGVAGRYASALFDIGRETATLERIETDLGSLRQALSDSDDLRRVLTSPLFERGEQGRALAAVAERLGLGDTVRNLVALMASKRRLFVLERVIAIFTDLLAEHRGEITADVTTARQLSEEQVSALGKRLAEATGRDVKMNILIDPALIGGLIVKMGSRMIDTSIATQLEGMKTAMKEVG